MVSNNFKSKAINIAFKSFLQEMKKYGCFLIVSEGCCPTLNRNDRNIEELTSLIANNMNSDNYTPSANYGKNLFNGVTNKFAPLINRNFDHNRREDSEYEYLVHCVNTFIQIIVEHGLMRLDKFKNRLQNVRFEQLGESIFVRAAKKIFGEDFKLQKPEPTDIMAQQPINEVEESFLNEKMRRYAEMGYSPKDAYMETIKELINIRQRILAQAQAERENSTNWGPMFEDADDYDFNDDFYDEGESDWADDDFEEFDD